MKSAAIKLDLGVDLMAGGKAESTIITTVVKDLLGDAAEAVERDVARDAARTAARDAARDAAETGARDAARDAAETGARDAAETGARDAARDTGERAGRQGARDATEAGQDTTRRVGDRTATEDPIDVTSGEVLLHTVDVELAGILPLVLDRTHISSYRTGRWFGPSWSSMLDQRLEVDAAGSCLVGTEGLVLVYPVPMFGEVALPERGPRRPLAVDSDGAGYSVTDRQQGRTLHFAAQPNAGIRGGRAMVLPLRAITDRNGHRIDLMYDAEGNLTEVRHSGGYRIGVTIGATGGGRITALRLLNADEQPVLARYAYDEAGRLTEVVNAAGRTTRYEYDAVGRLTRWVDGNGTWYSYVYDEQGRCVRGTGPDGRLATTLSYFDRATVVTDSLGNQTTYHLNENRQITAEVDPQGGTTWSEWSYQGQLLARTDPLTRITRYSYDEHGNVTAVTRPDGGRGTAAYNDLDLPVEITGADGAVWRQEYDERGNLTSVIDPMGATTRYEYDRDGRLTAVTDAVGAVTRVDTDAAGLPISVTDPLGNTTRLSRDAFGRVVSSTDALGTVNEFGWTRDGKPAWWRRPDGSTERWAYDPAGHVVEHVDATGAATRTEVSHFGVPAAVTRPGGARVEFSYDTRMRLVSVTNPQGLEWRYTYDAAGNLVEEVDFNGRVTTFAYDVAGQLVRRTNGAGQTVEYAYDALGHVVGKRSGDAVTTFAYDPAGRLVQAVNADADVRLHRNARGQVVAEMCNGRVLASEYDALGRRTRRRTPSGAEAAWQYDPASRPVALFTAGQTLHFGYDAAGREVRRRIGNGAVLDQRWDAGHRLISQTLWGAPTPDPAVRPPQPPQPPQPPHAAQPRQPRLLQHRTYSYDPAGNVTGVGDQVLAVRQFTLDVSGQVIAVQGSGWGEQYAYDPAGNLTHAEWPTATTPPTTVSPTTVSPDGDAGAAGAREYDGTLLIKAGGVRYEYDAHGRVVLRQHKRLSSGPRTWRHTWDADDRLIAVVTPDGQEWRYRYDPFGRRIAKQRLTADGQQVVEQIDFTWDEFILAEQAHTRFAGTGAETGAGTGAGAGGPQTRITTWEHEPGGFRPITQTERAPLRHAPQQWIDERFHAIVTDLVGSPAELVDPEGNLGWQVSTSLWGAPLAARPGDISCPLRFPGQYFDPETGLHYNLHRYYNPADGRYQSSDPAGLIAGPGHYSYVRNPLNQFDLLGLDGCTITVYRKQTEHPQSQRLSVDADGNVTLRGQGKLYVNMSDDISHTRSFRTGEGEIVAFDVPTSFRDHVRDIAVPQRNPGDFTPAEWKEMLRICPEISDPTKGADLYGIPSSMFGELRDAIIPGSGRVLSG